MALRAIDILCNTCEHKWDDLIEVGELESAQLCPSCGERDGYRTISAPNGMRAAYPDGTKRKGFAVMKEASKLNVAASQASPSARKEIEKEIRKMGVRISKDS